MLVRMSCSINFVQMYIGITQVSSAERADAANKLGLISLLELRQLEYISVKGVI